jgi:alpha-L-fucosidase 2
VSGLKARGDVTVDVRWTNGQAEEILLRSGRDQTLHIRSDIFSRPFSVTLAGSASKISTTGSGDVRSLPAAAGQSFILRRETK